MRLHCAIAIADVRAAHRELGEAAGPADRVSTHTHWKYKVTEDS